MNHPVTTLPLSVNGHPDRYAGSHCPLTVLGLLILLLTLWPAESNAQDPMISYTAKNKPLDVVLEDLMQGTALRFAFDAEAFRKIRVTFSVEDEPFGTLTALLRQQYGIGFRLVEGTWIVTRGQLPAGAPLTIFPQVPEPVTTRTVSGYVTDQTTGEPLLYCHVLFSENRGTMTNDLGYFRFDAPPGEVVLSLTHLGYHRLDTLIRSGDPVPLSIRLVPFTLMMEEVSVVTREKEMLDMGDHAGRTGFNPARSANLPRLAHDDLANMLTLIPGVSLLGGSQGGLSIRGSDPSENLVLLDGIPLLETGHLFGNLSVLNAGFVRQAFVSRGGFDARFGDRAAGLIELTGKTGSRTSPTGEASANLLNGNLMASIPLGSDVSVTGAWRRSYIDQWQNYLFRKLLGDTRLENNGNLEANVLPAVIYQDINVKVSIHPSATREITFSMLHSKDQQMMDYRIGEKPVLYRNEWAREANTGFSGNYNFQTGKWSHLLSGGFSEFYHEGERESGEEVVATIPGNNGKGNSKKEKKLKPVNPNRNSYEADSDSNKVSEYRIGWKSEVKTGIFRHDFGAGLTGDDFSYRFMTITSEKNIPVDSLQAASTQQMGHLFYQQVIEPAPFLTVRWGIRSNYSLQSKKIHWQPRFGVEYRPAEPLKLYYMAGVYNQYLSKALRVDINRQIGQVWYLPGPSGNGLLKASHHVAGFHWEKKGFAAGAEVYRKKSSGKRWLFAEEYRAGSESRIRYAEHQGQSAHTGADLFIQYRHSGFTHQAGWSVATSEEMIEGINDGVWFPAINDNRHSLRLTEIFALKGWTASVNWVYQSGQPRSIPTSGEAANTGRLPFFSQLDAGIAKTFQFSHTGITGGVSLLNILNRLNVVRIDYLNIVSDTQTFNVRSNVSTLSFTPLFFLKVQFF